MRRGIIFGLAGLIIISIPGMRTEDRSDPVTIFMCGDVMTGRGIDQVLPHPSDPVIYESYMKSAEGYVELAERANGPIAGPVSYSYIWGDALVEFERFRPDLRIINLETSVTRSDDYWKAKGINYRMHPDNAPCLEAAGIDFCSLANNHTLDWGYTGLQETLRTLDAAKVKHAGAGLTLQDAESPAVLEAGDKGRVIILAYGMASAGVLPAWSAQENKPGVNLLRDFSDHSVRRIREIVENTRKPGDIVVFSIHWGSNWGYTIPDAQVRFAHKLIDEADVDIIHGHSSHHVKGIEVYKNKPILYGCGDFLNDYEGIGGHGQYRPDLSLMYFIRMDPGTGNLAALHMVPTRIRNFRIRKAGLRDAIWLRNTLQREGGKFNTDAELQADKSLLLMWD